MKLYHGTSARYLDNILSHSLRPRNDAPGRWAQYPSRPDMVYLTSAYPFFFGCHDHENLLSPALVIEIDSARLDQHLLYPDEDFVVQAAAKQSNKPISEIHDAIRAELVEISETCKDTAGKPAPTWEASLAALTTCCYRGVIPRHAMTRYCLLDHQQRLLLGAMAYNEGPGMDGPHEQYRQLTQWMFGNRRKLPTFIPTNFIKSLVADCPRVASLLRHPDFTREENDRTGITVVNL